MNSKVPPTPPDNRSHKGPGEQRHDTDENDASARSKSNPDKQGQQGNTKVNTINQGYQQDR
ncbi:MULTISPECIES: hypothetical protein [unclassified Sinorhizobium]|uniref:hypothetical protein n=1 Tax=unclassified Sinorhizobium TaxID=2613772 RepID=UPI0035269306